MQLIKEDINLESLWQRMSTSFVPKVIFFLIQLTTEESTEPLVDLFVVTQGHDPKKENANKLQAVSIELLGFYCQRFPDFAQFVQKFVRELILILIKTLPEIPLVQPPPRPVVTTPTKRNTMITGGHDKPSKKVNPLTQNLNLDSKI